jgi:hypothetical protein
MSDRTKEHRAGLVDSLAQAAWGVLNHDNDPTSGKPDDRYNWINLRAAIRVTLLKNGITA